MRCQSYNTSQVGNTIPNNTQIREHIGNSFSNSVKNCSSKLVCEFPEHHIIKDKVSHFNQLELDNK